MTIATTTTTGTMTAIAEEIESHEQYIKVGTDTITKILVKRALLWVDILFRTHHQNWQSITCVHIVFRLTNCCSVCCVHRIKRMWGGGERGGKIGSGDKWAVTFPNFGISMIIHAGAYCSIVKSSQVYFLLHSSPQHLQGVCYVRITGHLCGCEGVKGGV